MAFQLATLPGLKKPGLTLQQALEEANRCLLCHDAPCSSDCPGGTDPARFIRQIRFLNFKGAARTILRNNPLGGVCAHVCPSERTCKRGCVRAGLDRPIDIDGLQRFAVEYGRTLGVKPWETPVARNQKVAIVGSGPAGLTTATNLARLGYGVTVFEAKGDFGGMLRYGVPEARLSTEDLDSDLAGMRDLGIEWVHNRIVDQNQAKTLLNQGFSAVFLAPGCWHGASLPIPGADLAGVETAVDFLAAARTDPAELATRVSGRRVAIIGGGSVAMDVALTATQAGARRVYLIALEGPNQLPATPEELHQALALGVILKPQARITRIIGTGGVVSAVEGTEIEWLEPNNTLPSNAVELAGTQFSLPVGLVVQAIGQKADSVARAMVETVDGTTVLSGGDIVRGAGTVVEAVGDGKMAAEAIHTMLSKMEEAK